MFQVFFEGWSAGEVDLNQSFVVYLVAARLKAAEALYSTFHDGMGQIFGDAVSADRSNLTADPKVLLTSLRQF